MLDRQNQLIEPPSDDSDLMMTKKIEPPGCSNHSRLLKKGLWPTLLNIQKPRVFCVARSSPCGAKFILCVWKPLCFRTSWCHYEIKIRFLDRGSWKGCFGGGSKGPFKQKFLQNRISKFWIFQKKIIKIFMTWNADLFSPLSLARTHLIPFPVDSPHEITPGKRKKSTFHKVCQRPYFNSREWYMYRMSCIPG